MASSPRLLMAILLSLTLAQTQGNDVDPTLANYRFVDSVMTAPAASRFTHPDSLSNFIKRNFKDEHIRLRAVFRWVTHHISYSYSYKNMSLQQVFKNRKAVCAGYSDLLNDLCRKTGVTCRVVTGLAKNDDTFLDEPNDSYRHAWNIATLSGKQYLLDATWAAGYCIQPGNTFVRKFNNSYYLTKPEQFALQHYPDNKEDQLLEDPATYQSFASAPVFTSHALNIKLDVVAPLQAEIKVNRKSYIPFEVKTETEIRSIAVGYRHQGSTYTEYIDPKFIQDEISCTFHLKLEEPGDYILTVFINQVGALYYKASVGWK
jgi:Transglutaminase-like superfamily